MSSEPQSVSTEPITTESRPPTSGVLEEQTAERPASPRAAPRGGRFLSGIVDLLQDLAIAVVVCVLLITYVVQAFRVDGTSMAPGLVDGERILVNKLGYHFQTIERGDVVVFWYPDDPDISFIKRVIGLPGETIEIRHGEVLIDGRSVEESYVATKNSDGQNYPQIHVRPGHYFVLGDNRRGSNDSRNWGLVPRRYIYGEAFLKIWPLSKLGPIE